MLAAESDHGHVDVTIPLIDISGWRSGSSARRREIAGEVDRACREIGFLIIGGHSVSPDVVERIERTTRAFFDLPLEVKLSYASKDPSVFRGYARINTAALARAYNDEASPPDFRETFSINRISIDPADPYFTTEYARRIFAPNIWPDVIGDFQASWEEYYRSMEQLASELMQIFATALGLEETFFEDRIDKHTTGLLASNYPEPIGDLIGNQIRAGAHTDYGSLTILHAEKKPGGLQVQTAEGVWKDVPIIPGAFVINIGDLLARWTNDRWVSTIHRVVNPPHDRIAGSRRQSFAFFHQPNYDAVIECLPTCRGEVGPRYEPINSGEYLESKLIQIQTPGARKSHEQ